MTAPITAYVKYEVDIQSLFGLLCTAVCTHCLRPRNSPSPPAFGLKYEGAIGQLR
jgi:hypothetical protein